MNLRFGLLSALKSGRWLALPLLLAGCRHESVVPNPVVDYFPVVVGTYRTYAVTDSVWTNATPAATSYQFRERVSEQFTDAAGKPAYRLVRSKRASASAAWVDDSVLVVQPSAQAVLLTRNNVRTVELIYPARAGRGWNVNALNGSPDTITSQTRIYGPSVGTPYTTPASGSQPAKTYDNTVLTKLTLDGGIENLNALNQMGLRQVYANGVGLILRRRFSFATYTTNPDGSTNLFKNVQSGTAHDEVLIDSGTI
ncbi:hypothetical protein GKZ68_07305 [Hymenobacter sp. BRD128]|uniref:hypothetical protein n=1 Tax=Hymenobacter sp. BRD128 TaxID=2675878 RepID=UPI0015678F37|nr:hypothetical protein [Hymenobacter sp. BRD128]QKG56457.1 hypothetical protein GKZ68_07305 [Hymenobacter sp. BRD128]